jgi:hypothetical protein
MPEDVELKIPIAASVDGSEKEVTARIISKWMDELIRVPGTNFRIGLDPIMSFVPGIGDFLASSLGLVTVIESVRIGVAPSVIGRMGLNMATNALIGIVPIIGPVFSAFFKSNTRNLQLLRRWQEGEAGQVKKSSRMMMGIVVGLLFLLFSIVLVGWSFILWSLWTNLRGAGS